MLRRQLAVVALAFVAVSASCDRFDKRSSTDQEILRDDDRDAQLSARLSAEQLQEATLTVERSLCKGSCPAYDLTVHGDGRVEFAAEPNTTKVGKGESRITEAEARKLVVKFMKAKAFPSTAPPAPPTRDAPRTQVSLSFGGQREFLGATASQEAQDCIVKLIETTTAVEQWVGSAK